MVQLLMLDIPNDFRHYNIFHVSNCRKAEAPIRYVKEKSEVPVCNPLATLPSLLRVVGPWPNKHNLITLQIKVSYLSADFK